MFDLLFHLFWDLVRLCGRLAASLLRPLGAAQALGPVFPLVSTILGLALLVSLLAGGSYLAGLYLGLAQ